MMTLLNLVQNNSRILTEDIVKKSNIDRSIAFRRLKKIGYT